MFIDLFKAKKGNTQYNQFINDEIEWHKIARDYWNTIYNQYKNYLDDNFPTKFPNEFLNCLWELKLISYLGSLKIGHLAQNQKGKIQVPDFKLLTNDKCYYIEAVCATKGSAKNYPYLNTPLTNIATCRDGTIGHREYRERMTGAFRVKAQCKYDPIRCDLNVCNHEQNSGYKQAINSSGYIVAISMSDIDFMNQPMNWRIDLSCFFPCSPYMTMDIDQKGSIHDTYHAYSPSFNKGKNGNSSINVDIFGTPKYSHVSAVLISHCWQVLFPDLSKHVSFLYYVDLPPLNRTTYFPFATP